MVAVVALGVAVVAVLLAVLRRWQVVVVLHGGHGMHGLVVHRAVLRMLLLRVLLVHHAYILAPLLPWLQMRRRAIHVHVGRAVLHVRWRVWVVADMGHVHWNMHVSWPRGRRHVLHV